MSKEIDGYVVKQETVQGVMSIEDIEKNFNSFVKEIDSNMDKMSTVIQNDELNQISDEILKAKEYIETFSRGETKSFKEKTLSHLGNVPMIGDWAKGKYEEVRRTNFENSSVKEIIEGIFNTFEEKKKRLIVLSENIDLLRSNLQVQEAKLEEYIVQLDYIIDNTTSSGEKLKAIDMSIVAQSQRQVVKEMLYNQIDFILNLMETLMVKIVKTLPVLKNTLNSSVNIAATINSMKDTVEMMNSLEELTNKVTQESTNNIQSLIIDVMDNFSEKIDEEFYEKAADRNIQFTKDLIDSRKKYIEKSVKGYKNLKSIEVKMQQALLERANAEEETLQIMQSSTISSEAV